ncbi:MAG: ImmA/IrrE family metallo-endopeptidase [Erysipelotrichaceae bacterium]|jgi:hypothetical protein|nr:ImmA/IrrE family metallo-endopeptidase [Erysipelotrichaceae bacterium]
MHYNSEDFIVEMVADIYEDHCIGEYGFDPIQLCKNMGHLVLPFDSFVIDSEKDRSYLLEKEDKDGFSWYNPITRKCEIYYNSNRKPWLRHKFTISHELGHIEFGHVFEKRITKYMEEVANEFARQLYVPQIILYKKKITTVHEIMSMFNVTENFAFTVLDRLNSRLVYHGTEFSDHEYRILEAFDYNLSHRK